MTRASARLPLLLLFAAPAPAFAFDARLAAPVLAESDAAPGMTLSAGPGREVCARATFDAAKAEDGGLVFVADAGGLGDEAAVRASAAVLARSAAPDGALAALARRAGVPALSLGRGVWDASVPDWTLELPAFGPERDLDGLRVRPAGPPVERVLREGDAVCVDADAGRARFPAPERAEAVLAAAEAARAFDGLRDAGALARWLSGAPDAERAADLMAELAPRALDGELAAADLSRLDRAARAAAGADAPRVARAESRAWGRALARAAAELDACPASAADAPALDALERLAADARALSSRAASAGKVLGLGAGQLPGAAKACLAAVARARARRPPRGVTLAQAAASAGARVPPASEIGPEAWRAFAAPRLAAVVSDLVSDASRGLREKSRLIQARVLSEPLPPSSTAGRLIAAAAAPPCELSGADGSARARTPEELPAAAKAAWAASWAPGPLGARLRAGRGADYDGRLRVVREIAADARGLLFTRDPASLRRGRAVVEAGEQRWLIDAATGLPLLAPARPSLSRERLARLARLARALDAREGAAVEAAFAFSGPDLFVLDAHALAPSPDPRLAAP